MRVGRCSHSLEDAETGAFRIGKCCTFLLTLILCDFLRAQDTCAIAVGKMTVYSLL